MQFTGLKDKNGKAIYEGDIVKPNQATMPAKPRPLSEKEWEQKFQRLYGKPPTGGELWQFQKNFPTPVTWGDSEEAKPTNPSDDGDEI